MTLASWKYWKKKKQLMLYVLGALLGCALAMRAGGWMGSSFASRIFSGVFSLIFDSVRLKIADLIGAGIGLVAGMVFGGPVGAVFGTLLGGRILGLIMMTPLGQFLHWMCARLLKASFLGPAINAMAEQVAEVLSAVIGAVVFAPIGVIVGAEIFPPMGTATAKSSMAAFSEVADYLKTCFLTMSDTTTALVGSRTFLPIGRRIAKNSYSQLSMVDFTESEIVEIGRQSFEVRL